ncbi:hypothetical protein M595_4004 [Lyngbya aestuarii BL J]|uniref:DNA-binding protein n=1 Tax=Lyngbya aestuarii BL J TaxID=1348334 RepID=U7QI38_9CYAN|nr:hypothetical protein [Lyngbya aestuarii]ERT06091.1 hypothetical protein M595_4004 [Lyngbya aestuarii BL J]
MNLKNKIFGATIILSTTLFSLNLPSLAQVPIQNLQRTPGLTISGEVTGVWGNNFVVNDGTGQILVDAGPSWWHSIDVSVGERVTVVGEYDDDDFDRNQSGIQAPS